MTVRRVLAVAAWMILGATACSSSSDPAATLDGGAQAPVTTVSTADATEKTVIDADRAEEIMTGAATLVADDFVLLRNRRVGLIAHAASMVGDDHLADLIDEQPDVELVALFGPEHGLRGTGDAGEIIADAVDESTRVPIYSLYGDTRRPTADMLDGVEVLVYDLQDVGARYFTYISTMGLAMQAAAEADIPFVVLDRPNPIGGTVSGFVREADVESFIAQYPIADTYGLTAGELAEAIVGEQWLPGVDSLDLRVVPMTGWTARTRWPDTGLEWIAPSPSLQSVDSALLYPALVLFEATTVSVGRGTILPFEVFGAPGLDGDTLTDQLNELQLPGVAFEPIGFIPEGDGVPHTGTAINGVRVVITDHQLIEPADLGVHILHTVLQQPGTRRLIDNPDLLDLLAGGPTLRTQLEDGMTANEIISTRSDLEVAFASTVGPYRMYPSGE